MTKASGSLIALAAGGTGGHMFPAEALAQELKRRGHHILLLTDARGERFAKNFPSDERLVLVAATISTGGMLSKIRAGFSIVSGLVKAVMTLRSKEVSAAVGFGGYPSYAGMKAASVLNIPYGVHEQNGVLGRANRQLVGNAKFTAHGFPSISLVPQSSQARLKEVGNPVRDAVNEFARSKYDLPGDGEQIKVLVFGGSQGASLFSSEVPIGLSSLPRHIVQRLHIVHQARQSEVDEVTAVYQSAGVSCVVKPFFEDLPRQISDAHLVIARAGASTVTEISTIGRPSILVPLAIAMDDHQTGNAKNLSDEGGAVLIPEDKFTRDKLVDVVTPLFDDFSLLAQMASRATGRVQGAAASKLADLVEEISRW